MVYRKNGGALQQCILSEAYRLLYYYTYYGTENALLFSILFLFFFSFRIAKIVTRGPYNNKPRVQ